MRIQYKAVIVLVCVILLWIIYRKAKKYFTGKKVFTGKKLPLRTKTPSKTIQLSGFPPSVTAKEAKEYLEQYTGEGSIYALKFRQSKTGRRRRSCAVAQFTSAKDAERILKLAKRQLQYDSDTLEAERMENDVVPRPLIPEHSVNGITLHFGCQIDISKFMVLWSGNDVSLNFSHALRKLYFVLPFDLRMYKLELSYGSIRQIQLRRPRGGVSKYLLFQLSGCPFVYEKGDSVEEFDDIFVKETQDEHWARTVDFTPSSCIGQSSVLCLQLPLECQLPNLRETFAQFMDHKGQFILEAGVTFSRDSELVPIIDAPPEVELPFDILFKVNVLIQNGCLAGPTLDLNFFLKIDPRKVDKVYVEHALQKLYYTKRCSYDPISWLDEQYKKYLASKKPPKQPSISLDSGLVYIPRVQVTPCRVYFCGPEALVSNRVLRNYAEDIGNFIRVSFVDEDLERVHSTDLCPYGGVRTGIDKRIRSVLRNGIRIGDKNFEFLAFSSSQLQENSTWMFASRPGLTAADIRKWMGDFSQIRNVAKYAARLGQSLSSSTESLRVGKHEMEMIDDIEVETDGENYVFSDGIGKISAQFAQEVAKKCDIRGPNPSAFQIRYAGFKGVVAIDPSLPSSVKLALRKSMCKYESENDTLDVLAYSKYQACYLNRQVITLLSTLGVQDHIFEKKQRDVTDNLDSILTDPQRAEEALRLMTSGDVTNMLKEMLACGYKPDEEPFLSMMLQTFLASKLQELRTRTRVFIPKGRAMMGCLDETRTLEYGEIFVQVSGSRFRDLDKESLKRSYTKKDRPTYVVEGRVVVAKNPCLHPGDVRVLRAVDVPALRHMVDCVVFPQKGPRPHTNECSGSDLDGDVYFVCWDPELIPPRQIAPMDYSRVEAVKLDHEVTIEEVQDYFVNYIINHSLGVIANAHTVFADKEPEKAMSEPCVELAKLFSVAVDFPKTGVPAEIPKDLRVKEYPDFMEKPDKPTYESENVIGKLFRDVRDILPETILVPFTKEIAARCYDSRMEYDGFRDYLEDACFHKGQYDDKLGILMDYYGVKTEGEMLSGSIVRAAKRKDAEAIPLHVKSLKNEARKWFNDDVSPRDERAKYAKASAWYHVTYHPSYWGTYNTEGSSREHFLSFPWCVHDILLNIKKGRTGASGRGRSFRFRR